MEEKNFPKKILKNLLVISLVFLVLHILVVFLKHIIGFVDNTGIVANFDMDIELSIPSWYATILLFSASVLAWIISNKIKKIESQILKWRFVSLILLYMSIDEGSELHELAMEPTKNLLNLGDGLFYFAWVIPFGVLAIIIAIYLFNFWLKLEKNTRNLLLLSAIIYFLGALGLEMVGAYYISTGGNEFIYSLIVGAEETIELVGISVLIFALLRHNSEYLN